MAPEGGPHHVNGRPEPYDAPRADGAAREAPRRPTLNTAVRRRRADRAFYLRLAGAIRQNERALERLKR
jgi:hypothetical protein